MRRSAQCVRQKDGSCSHFFARVQLTRLSQQISGHPDRRQQMIIPEATDPACADGNSAHRQYRKPCSPKARGGSLGVRSRAQRLILCSSSNSLLGRRRIPEHGCGAHGALFVSQLLAFANREMNCGYSPRRASALVLVAWRLFAVGLTFDALSRLCGLDDPKRI